MAQVRLDLNLAPELVLHVRLLELVLNRTLSATMYLLRFSRARYTLPNLPRPRGLPMSKSLSCRRGRRAEASMTGGGGCQSPEIRKSALAHATPRACPHRRRVSLAGSRRRVAREKRTEAKSGIRLRDSANGNDAAGRKRGACGVLDARGRPLSKVWDGHAPASAFRVGRAHRWCSLRRPRLASSSRSPCRRSHPRRCWSPPARAWRTPQPSRRAPPRGRRSPATMPTRRSPSRRPCARPCSLRGGLRRPARRRGTGI